MYSSVRPGGQLEHYGISNDLLQGLILHFRWSRFLSVVHAARLRFEEPHQIALSMPAPLSGRIDALLAVAEAGDVPVTRNELVAALFYDAQLCAEELAKLLKQYRTARVKDVFVRGFDKAIFLKPLRRQGPRKAQVIEEAVAKQGGGGTPDIDPGELLQHAFPYRLGPTIPGPLSAHLDTLVGLAESAGERTTRKEVAAALVFAAPTKPEELARLVMRYREAPPPRAPGRVIRRRRGRPGRRL